MEENRPLLAGDLRERMRDEIWSHKLWRAVFAEFLGTLLFVHFICGAIVASANNLLVLAASLALIIMVLSYCFSEISGAYFNPAVTLAAVLVREISLVKGFLYFLAQLGGAVMGVVILYALVPHSIADSKAFEIIVTDLRWDLSRAEGLFIEVVATFLLVFVYLLIDINHYKRPLKPLTPMIIAATFAACVLFADTFTGASMNPARSFGAAAIVNHWRCHWIYWIGPLLGSLLATLFFKIFETHWHDLEKEGGLKRGALEPSSSTVVITE